MKKASVLSLLSASLVVLLAACAVPAAIQPEREQPVSMPVRDDGVTQVSGVVPGYDLGAGNLRASFDVRSQPVEYASGHIDEGGNFILELLNPPRQALLEVRDAWPVEIDLTVSNPTARLAFLYFYSVHQDRERPSGWIFMDTVTDPEQEPRVGDRNAAYVYAHQPTRVRINASTTGGGQRYVSDLNLARGWNRVVSEVTTVSTGVITIREYIDYSTSVPWQFEEAD